MAVFNLTDPRLDASCYLQKKVEVQLKRVHWDRDTLKTSFRDNKKNTTSMTLKTVIQNSAAYVTISSPVIHEAVRRNSVESMSSTCSDVSGKSNAENDGTTLQYESLQNYKHDLLPSSPEAKRRKNADDGGKKICYLEKEPTLLENYLMRIHELVRIAVDETYVENQCKKLLSTMVKTVSFDSKGACSERRL